MIQQQVEEIRFEQVYIQKIRHKAQKTNKIRDWLSLLKAYHENNLFQQKDQTIRTMHFKFILNEDFWIQQITRKRQQEKITKKDIQFMMMALDDGYYTNAAEIVYQILIKQLNQSQNNSGELRSNFLIAQIQKIILIFKRGLNFFPSLRQYYAAIQNQAKIRQIYLREIKFGYDNVDIVYDQYTEWQKKINPTYLLKSGEMYEMAKASWEQWNFKGRAQFHDLNQTDRGPYESINELKLIDKLETDSQKLRYLRIICLGRHELISEYFEKLQFHFRGDEELLIKSYKNVLDMIPEVEVPYLRFLTRRINKHIQQTQDKQYNDKWSENVQFFREQITQLINKPRLTPKTQQSIRQSYYNYWVDVETSLIKDKDSVCQIFQALLQLKNSVELYTKYSMCMIRLGYFADAKHILKRSYTAFKYDYEAYKQYENFISVYGNIEDAIQFRNLKMIEKQKESMDIQTNNLNGVTKNSKLTHNQQIVKAQSDKRPNSNKENKIKTIINQQMIEERAEKMNKNKIQFQKSKQISKDKEKTEKQKKSVKEKENEKDKVKEREREREREREKNNRQSKQAEIKMEDEEEEKRQKNKKEKMHTDSGNTLFIKGFSNNWREQQVKNIIKNKEKIKQIRLIQKMGHFQNYCYVQMISSEDAAQQVEINKNNKQITVAISRPPTSYNEDKTLFLCALPQTTTYEKIRALFKQQNDSIVDIRLKLDQNKNIAYVDFVSAEVALSVFQKYSNASLTLDDKKILIRQSHSKPVLKKKQLKVLILKQLAFKAKEKDIIEFFKDFSLEDVFIPENDQGKSKGFAFVKFKNENEFYEALSMKKGTIKSKTFQIHRSDRDIQRPKREKKEEKQVNNNYFSDLFK